MEVAEGVRRIGSRWINFYLLEEGGRLTLLDAGLPGYWKRLESELRSMGKRLEDIDAVLLTHMHPDHTGLADRVRRASRASVFVHPDDAAVVKGEAREARPAFLKQGWRPFLYRYMVHAISHGVTRGTPVGKLSMFADGDVLDVPGRPRVIHTPGHTPGSCALLLEKRGVLFSGDAVVTMDLLAGTARPALPPDFVDHDAQQAIESARALQSVEAQIMLPGHGDPWTGGVREAVRLAIKAASQISPQPGVR
jgi:glyoxylase-like metal-dependent hydrolase (beta-lactamase superfamily II)